MGFRAERVFRWDLDKTYLKSEFDSVRDLAKAAMETAQDKQAYPGARALLRALSRHHGYRICIISGSPTQMRRVLAAKLALDGIEYSEFVLKNNLRNLMRGRLRSLRSQIPYKLPALLESRARLVGTPPETLFGDDAEADAIIYLLYADVIAGKVDAAELERILLAARAYPDEIDRTVTLAESILATSGPADSVQRILIHLEARSPTATFARFGRRVVPIFNYFQAALVLYADGAMTARQVLYVALEMLESTDYELSTLANSLQDLMRRGRMTTEVASRLALEANEAATSGALSGRDDLPPFDEIAWAFAERARGLGGAPPLEWPDAAPVLDYVSLVDEEHLHRRTKRRRRRTKR
ncbi:MAG TPA: hypothetical protein VML75_25880 [Kofleriaceae bacterium]|nr:hypothetical protein [Kofleriaceae bacterium]